MVAVGLVTGSCAPSQSLLPLSDLPSSWPWRTPPSPVGGTHRAHRSRAFFVFAVLLKSKGLQWNLGLSGSAGLLKKQWAQRSRANPLPLLPRHLASFFCDRAKALGHARLHACRKSKSEEPWTGIGHSIVHDSPPPLSSANITSLSIVCWAQVWRCPVVRNAGLEGCNS